MTATGEGPAAARPITIIMADIITATTIMAGIADKSRRVPLFHENWRTGP